MVVFLFISFKKELRKCISIAEEAVGTLLLCLVIFTLGISRQLLPEQVLFGKEKM